MHGSEERLERSVEGSVSGADFAYTGFREKVSVFRSCPEKCMLELVFGFLDGDTRAWPSSSC